MPQSFFCFYNKIHEAEYFKRKEMYIAHSPISGSIGPLCHNMTREVTKNQLYIYKMTWKNRAGGWVWEISSSILCMRPWEKFVNFFFKERSPLDLTTSSGPHSDSFYNQAPAHCSAHLEQRKLDIHSHHLQIIVRSTSQFTARSQHYSNTKTRWGCSMENSRTKYFW